jgi:hypothetical protein
MEGYDMTKKRLFKSLALLTVVGAVLVVSHIVWAAGDSVKKQEPVQVSQMDDAVHHPETQATGNATVSTKAELSSMQDNMKDGNMNDVMKDENIQTMMKDSNKQDMMKTMTDRGMNDMMNDSSMQDMMRMMETPEGKQMMEKCQELR